MDKEPAQLLRCVFQRVLRKAQKSRPLRCLAELPENVSSMSPYLNKPFSVASGTPNLSTYMPSDILPDTAGRSLEGRLGTSCTASWGRSSRSTPLRSLYHGLGATSSHAKEALGRIRRLGRRPELLSAGREEGDEEQGESLNICVQGGYGTRPSDLLASSSVEAHQAGSL